LKILSDAAIGRREASFAESISGRALAGGYPLM
jgi:hypothetical protein